MVFRKDSILHYEIQIFSTIMVVVCLFLIPILGGELSLMCAFPFIILLLGNCKSNREYITINETGITCQVSGKQLWAYRWEHIAELRKSSRFRMPSIEVIVYSKNGEPEQFARPNHYFQLGKKAKDALRRYYQSM